MKYTVNSRLKLNGVIYDVGYTVDLSSEEAASLEGNDAVTPINTPFAERVRQLPEGEA